MLSEKYKFIYIHIPKTGGNSIQDILLPLSDDKKHVHSHQDGIDRFGITGPITPKKHACLQDYADILGPDLKNYRIVTSIRHPFERAISGYFSPHRWHSRLKTTNEGAIDYYWDEAEFWEVIKQPSFIPMTEYLQVNGTAQTPDIIIRKEQFETSLNTCLALLGLPLPIPLSLPHRNASHVPAALLHDILNNTELREKIEAMYKTDMAFFNYLPYGFSER